MSAASILILLSGIERHGVGAPAASAFESALRQAGREANAAGGLRALVVLRREIAVADPGRAKVHATILATVWSDITGGSPGEREDAS